MSLPEPGTGLSWVGKTVVDREGAEIGRCTAVLTDDGTGLPEWLYASIDDRTAIVPLVDATEQDDRVRVTVGRTDVENAPPPAGDKQRLSQGEEAALYRHYGIEYSRDASETLLPADIESPDAGAGTPESAAPPSSGRVRALASAAGGLAGVGLLVAAVLGLRRRRSRPAPSGAADAAVRSVRAVSVAVARWATTVGAASAPVLSTAGRVVWRRTSAGATSALRTGAGTARLAAAVLPRAAAGGLRLAQSGLGAALELGGAVETVPDVVSETGERLQKGWSKSMGRFSLGLGFGAGYVLGARAGRARFEQIRQAAASFTQRPEVQQALEKVKGAAPGPLQSALGGLSRCGSGTTAGTVGLPPEVGVDSAVTTSTGSAAPPEPRGATDLPAGGPETP